MRLGFSALLLACLGGCVADGGVGVHARVVTPAVYVAPAPVVVEAPPPPPPEPVQAEVVVEQPDLVEVSPGIQVIADYDQPIFFLGRRLYWRNDGGIWYSSRVHTGG